MVFRHRKSVLLAVLLGTAVATAGCDQRAPSGTVGQKIDRGTDKVASATNDMANRAAVAVDDATITTKVKAAIVAEPGLRSLQIDVDTKDAVVTLSGTVSSEPLKSRAKEIASSVSGVRMVQDNLVMKASASG